MCVYIHVCIFYMVFLFVYSVKNSNSDSSILITALLKHKQIKPAFPFTLFSLYLVSSIQEVCLWERRERTQWPSGKYFHFKLPSTCDRVSTQAHRHIFLLFFLFLRGTDSFEERQQWEETGTILAFWITALLCKSQDNYHLCQDPSALP